MDRPSATEELLPSPLVPGATVLNVTDLAQAWVNSPSANHGLVLQPVDGVTQRGAHRGASLGGAVLAGGVTSGGIGLGFGLLAVVSLAVAVASVGLPAKPGSGAAEPARV